MGQKQTINNNARDDNAMRKRVVFVCYVDRYSFLNIASSVRPLPNKLYGICHNLIHCFSAVHICYCTRLTAYWMVLINVERSSICVHLRQMRIVNNGAIECFRTIDMRTLTRSRMQASAGMRRNIWESEEVKAEFHYNYYRYIMR